VPKRTAVCAPRQRVLLVADRQREASDRDDRSVARVRQPHLDGTARLSAASRTRIKRTASSNDDRACSRRPTGGAIPQAFDFECVACLT